ncbi:unnamed protein product [Xylocopa violacea]|uniref:Carboxylesterase type B domain-containing protein n=1 Tax=Xylocopa violacea TaxID=135666 RepID=A0ABP1NE38_XYLVO
MKLPCTILFYIIGIGCVFYCTAHPEATPPVGKIRGSILHSRLGKKIYSFRGIRYAEPPTGERRFEIATPAADWNDDVFDASKEGPACPNVQKTQLMSEDCLRLNVYTTKLPTKGEDVKRSVLVFFHPGAFYFLSAQSFNFGPEYLMDKDIVLVTTNYRLGSLGFISTGDASAPGNLGLKDQVIALRWVQRNIGAFGGDPNSVAISGGSIGALTAMLHVVSPMSKNLFHRAIVMSGSLLTAEPYPTEQNVLAKKQARLLNCTTDSSRAMLTCLKSKPVDSFINTMADFFEWHRDPIVIWKPVVEREIAGVERFLPAQPVDLIKQGKFHQVPVILGITKDEFGAVVVAFEKQTRNGDDMYSDMNDNWNRIAPISFMYERGTSRSEYISKELRKFYFDNQRISPATDVGLARIYADSVVIFPSYRVAKLIAENSKAPLYLYKFTYQGCCSFMMWNASTPYGVAHQDDLQYLFFMENFFPYFDTTAPENPMVELCTSIWTSFAQTGEPLPKSGIKWNRFIPEENNYLEINLTPVMRNGLYPDRMQEWEKLFPLSSPSQTVSN